MYLHHICIIATFRGLPLSNGEAMQLLPLQKCYNGGRGSKRVLTYFGECLISRKKKFFFFNHPG